MKSHTLHFIGIGGCGMNGVAQLATHAGYKVSGSDRATDLSLFQPLEDLGISIVPQDGSGITTKTDFVVYSTAIESDNPDIQRAKDLQIPLLHRAEMLAKLCEGKEVIAIAGTAGKSTVTGLLGWIFQCLGKDPTVYCGAPILNWKQRGSGIHPANQRQEAFSILGNVRTGSGPWILEADESDRSFLHFHPDHAIITNIAEDHFELSELRTLFAQFKSQVSGKIIQKPTLFHAPSPMLGKHNIENVDHALTLCKALDLDMEKCIEAVQTFQGVERRLERIGPHVIDDFAHSPIKIAASLEATASEYPAFSTYWRPHGFTPLFQGLEGFIEVFSNHWKKRPQDKLFILPVYYAGGTVNKKITSAQFVKRLKKAGVSAELSENFHTLEKQLLEENLPVLGMGARDPELPIFARRISSKLNEVYGRQS